MKIKIKSFWLALLILGMVFQPTLVSADISQDSIDYLASASQTAWVTMALVAADASGIATSHLELSGSDALDYAKTILAVTAVGQNPYTFGNVNYVSQLKGFYQDNQLGDTGMLMDDSFGILALSSAGLDSSEPEIADAKNYLLANQNDDGGWGYNVGVSSDSNSTAIIIVSLIEAGVSVDNSAISDGLDYLSGMQNNDGGWGWSEGSDSDTDSTSWVVWAIEKVGQEPGLWGEGGNNPIAFITSLENLNGSFGRTTANITANIMATQDAIIALSGKTLPLGYFTGEGSQEPGAGQYLLRIEGPDNAICHEFLAGTTAYDLLVAGQDVCGYVFVGNRDWGTFFLDSINEIENNFPAYWMYLVNNDATDSGLEQHILQTGDEILIYYDSDTNAPAYPDFDRPLKLTVDNANPDSGETITVTVEYYNQSWQPAVGATVFGADQNYQTNPSGQVDINLPAGYYTLYAQKDDYIRSNQEVVMVGDGVSQNVGLVVEVSQGGRGRIGGESIIFEITPSQLDFGVMRPGETQAQTISLNNDGTVNLIVTTVVTGDSLFTDNVQIENQDWSDYGADLVSGANRDQEVSLQIPIEYIGLGVKTGELIFWAQAQ